MFFRIRDYIRFPYIILAVIISVNIFFVNLPLLDSFNYEFCVGNAIFLSFVLGLATIHFKLKNEDTSSFFSFLTEHKYFYFLALIIPIVISLFNSVLFPRCPILEGFPFYLIITIPSVVFVFVIAILSYTLSKKRIAFLFFILLFLAVIIIPPFIELYRNPQVYFYNPIIGYFPGTIYDENIPIDAKLLLYRTTIVFLSLICLLTIQYLRKKRRIPKLFHFLVPLIIYILFFLLKPFFSFSTTIGTLNKQLSKQIITPHFVISYTNSAKINYPTLLALKHEYYFEEISNDFRLTPKSKIHSFIFKTHEQKRKLFGAGNADMAKPWLNQVYVNIADIDATLKHELVHAISSNFGVTLFKVAANINPALIEGVATAFDNNVDSYPVNTIAKIAYDSGYKVNLENLFSGLNFFSSYSSLAYVYAGSFIRYLNQKYGVEVVKDIYKDGKFKLHTGEKLNKLTNDYWQFLDSLTWESNNKTAQLYFAGLTVFKKFCARSAAEGLKSASQLYSQKQYNEASKKFKEIYNYSNSYSALIGYKNTLYKLGEHEKANQFINSQMEFFKNSQYYFNFQLNLANSYALSGNVDAANLVLDSLIINPPNYLYKSIAFSWKEVLMNNGLNDFIRFQHGDIDYKFEILMDLYKKTRNKTIIPSLVRYSEENDSTASKIKSVFFDNFVVDNQQSSYYALLLSKYFLNNMDFNTAKYFAVKSLDYKNQNCFYEVLVENLKMVNWFVNYYNDSVKEIRIIN